ncbi:polyketide cyclase / dehydrase and lipid transport [Mariprofundus micogutta]|uniref:Polyketide cyclase / dehydrase and lipid transport n=1 Tax=Mariprofundus micogutta TaxID=1921010 RepID=A0A1L8CL51_9PROT|nr:SRPBCC family protein [Mariprofundus micogutta]GAV19647.1 polyketide cyclase / dehydrase and lipid transport [Mariprofundus micogutta]
MPLSKLEVSVEINCPVSKVIAFVDDNENDPMWQTSVLQSEKRTEGAPAVGTIYHVKEKFLGRVIEQDWMVTERNADGSFWKAKSTTGPFPIATSMKFESKGNSTLIHRTLSIDVGRFFKVASPVVGHIAQRELEMDFANLKELLEAEA